jgi:RNA polymerase sigma factor (sigma-70 family)
MAAGTDGGRLTKDWDALADDELLHHYRDTRTPAALAEIIQRHQPMVFRTCLRLIGNVHDAEDATQSVFLVLTQRPEVVRRSLAGCLHELARAAVSELCRSRRRRTQREEMAARIHSLMGRLHGGFQPMEHQELREELDLALDQLPDALRQAVILRYLEGHSQQEAAQRAGCTRVTMGWRSMKGLERLRKILSRRGVALAPATLLAVLQAESRAAAVLSIRSAATRGATATATHLANALLRQSVRGSLLRKAAFIGVLATASLGLGAGIVFLPGPAKNVAANSAPPKPAPAPQVPVPLPPILGLFDHSLDIGGPTHEGAERFSQDTYTVQGGGRHIYDKADQFRFVYRPWTGDGEIIARVAYHNKDARQVAAGVMFREELTPESRHAALLISAIGHSDVKYRAVAGRGTACAIDDLSTRGKHWVRLIRRGTTFTAYVRPDGPEAWTLLKEFKLELNPSLYVGLAVTAHNDAKLATATFDHVSVRSRSER